MCGVRYTGSPLFFKPQKITTMSKKANAANVAKVENANVATTIDNSAVQQVINAINAEAKTFGAIIRNFVAVAKENATALYMLETILKHPFVQRKKETSTNDIRQAIIAAFPYVKDGAILHKVNGLYVPYEQYSGDIIKKAFYNAVGATKVQKDFAPATEEQIAEAEAKAEEKKAKRQAKAEQKKADAELLKKFWDECMKATEANIWDIVSKYKVATTETELTSK